MKKTPNTEGPQSKGDKLILLDSPSSEASSDDSGSSCYAIRTLPEGIAEGVENTSFIGSQLPLNANEESARPTIKSESEKSSSLELNSPLSQPEQSPLLALFASQQNLILQEENSKLREEIIQLRRRNDEQAEKLRECSYLYRLLESPEKLEEKNKTLEEKLQSQESVIKKLQEENERLKKQLRDQDTPSSDPFPNSPISGRSSAKRQRTKALESYIPTCPIRGSEGDSECFSPPSP